MGLITDKVRAHVGEGELEEAIDLLVHFLKGIGGDMYNQSIHQSGLYKSYLRDRMQGIANNAEEKNKISISILNLAAQIDRQELENPQKAKVPHDESMPPAPQPPPYSPPPSTATPPTQARAQCFFNGDMMQYYITQNDQIMAVNPLTNQSLIVGVKMPSQHFNFAWTYYVNATGIYYMVDHAGIIWGQNFGMPVQVGYVKYFN